MGIILSLHICCDWKCFSRLFGCSFAGGSVLVDLQQYVDLLLVFNACLRIFAVKYHQMKVSSRQYPEEKRKTKYVFKVCLAALFIVYCNKDLKIKKLSGNTRSVQNTTGCNSYQNKLKTLSKIWQNSLC